jgi:hypothetical protein
VPCRRPENRQLGGEVDAAGGECLLDMHRSVGSPRPDGQLTSPGDASGAEYLALALPTRMGSREGTSAAERTMLRKKARTAGLADAAVVS